MSCSKLDNESFGSLLRYKKCCYWLLNSSTPSRALSNGANVPGSPQFSTHGVPDQSICHIHSCHRLSLFIIVYFGLSPSLRLLNSPVLTMFFNTYLVMTGKLLVSTSESCVKYSAFFSLLAAIVVSYCGYRDTRNIRLRNNDTAAFKLLLLCLLIFTITNLYHLSVNSEEFTSIDAPSSLFHLISSHFS